MKSLSPVVEVDADKCVNCHACIGACPVKHCNDASSGDHVNVNHDTCIGCGQCIDACDHDARHPVDDLHVWQRDLESGEVPMIAIVAPAVAVAFPETYLHFNGWLMAKGVDAVFDVSFGAELTVKSYLDHVETNDPKCVIAQPCPALVTYVETYRPELLAHLAPADSPMLHLMKWIRAKHPEFADHRIAVMSPCIAKKREFDATGHGDYNVTFSSLKDMMAADRVDLSTYPIEEFANPPAERAVLFSSPGGLLRTAERFNADIGTVTRKIEGPEIVYKYLDGLASSIKRGTAPLVVDCLNCEYGCNVGTGNPVENLGQDDVEHLVEQRRVEMEKLHRNAKAANKTFDKAWDPNIYRRSYVDRTAARRLSTPSNEQHAEIFRQMAKRDGQQEDVLNCGSCGYGNCDDMALAIHNGSNRVENCHLYRERQIEAMSHQLQSEHTSLQQQVHDLLLVVNRASDGDLTVRAPVTEGSLGAVASALNNMFEDVAETLESLKEMVDTNAVLGDGINQTALAIVQRAKQQADAVQNASQAVAEMSRELQRARESAGHADGAAQDTQDKVLEGTEIVDQTTRRMEELRGDVQQGAKKVKGLGDRTLEISDIVDAIKDINSQTNILALNAAIEASRAGEHGKGFSVVANQIQRLSESTGSSASDIERMVKSIQSETQEVVRSIEQQTESVENQMQRVVETGTSLGQIKDQSDVSVKLVGDIAAIATVQADKVASISTVMQELLQVSTENENQSQETIDAVRRLTSAASELKSQIDRFVTS